MLFEIIADVICFLNAVLISHTSNLLNKNTTVILLQVFLKHRSYPGILVRPDLHISHLGFSYCVIS